MPYSNGVYTPPTGAENASAGTVIRSATWNTIFTDISTALTTLGTISLSWVIGDITGSAFSTGVKGYLYVPYDMTINGWRIMADQSGSCVIDVWNAPFASYPPTVADTITASAKPTLSAAAVASSTTLTGWTTAITAGDVLGFNVDSNATCKQVTFILDCGLN